VGESSAVAGFLAIHEHPLAGSLAGSGIEKRRGVRQVRRAEAIESSGARDVLIRRGIPQLHGLDQVIPFQDLERSFVDDPTGNKRAFAAMIADNPVVAAGGIDLMVHQHGEGAIAIIESAHSIRQPNHLVAILRRALRGMSDGKERRDFDTGRGRYEIGSSTEHHAVFQ
jgi:hypothetical protein